MTPTENPTHTPTAGATSAGLPVGNWVVDTAASDVAFMARGGFGLMPARGQFKAFTGSLKVDGTGAAGELVVSPASVETKNQALTKHLLTPDFFDVDRYPTLTFKLISLVPASAGTLTGTGTLSIREGSVRVEFPVTTATRPDGSLELKTALKVGRAAAGMDQSNKGMVQGKAHLNVSLVFRAA